MPFTSVMVRKMHEVVVLSMKLQGHTGLTSSMKMMMIMNEYDNKVHRMA